MAEVEFKPVELKFKVAEAKFQAAELNFQLNFQKFQAVEEAKFQQQANYCRVWTI